MKHALCQQKTVLFDFDGTIADTRGAISSAYIGAISQILGVKTTPDEEQIREMLKCRPMEYFERHYGELASLMYEKYETLYDNNSIEIFDGISDLFEQFDANGIGLGIVTNKARKRVLSDMDVLSLQPGKFLTVVCAEDHTYRKPDPEGLKVAIEQASLSSHDVWYVGDGPHDIAAANAAGLNAIGVTWGYYPKQQISDVGPCILVDHPSEIATALKL